MAYGVVIELLLTHNVTSVLLHVHINSSFEWLFLLPVLIDNILLGIAYPVCVCVMCVLYGW